MSYAAGREDGARALRLEIAEAAAEGGYPAADFDLLIRELKSGMMRVWLTGRKTYHHPNGFFPVLRKVGL